MSASPVTEYGLLVQWEGKSEVVVADDVHHAEQMRRTIYAAQRCGIVKRTLYITPWIELIGGPA